MNLTQMVACLLKTPYGKGFITNLGASNPIGRVLLLYSAAPFLNKKSVDEYSHTFYWEVCEMVNVLGGLGFSIDLVDRGADIHSLNIKDAYDVFLGLGASNSGHNYPKIARLLPSAIKVLYVTSQSPEVFNRAILERYQYFHARHPQLKLPPIGLKENIDMQEVIALTDYIFCVGNDVTAATYSGFGKKLYNIRLSTHPGLSFSLKESSLRSPNEFLYFGGNRNILKGLDLLIEAFACLPHLKLHVCTPANEPDFNSVYKETLARAKNIIWEGFVAVGGARFAQLSSCCSFAILPSSTEGMSTSIMTCMRKGLIPVITKEVGVSVSDFGFLIDDISVQVLVDKLSSISEMDPGLLATRSIATYQASFQYTQAGFTESFTTAILDIIAHTPNIVGLKENYDKSSCARSWEARLPR